VSTDNKRIAELEQAIRDIEAAVHRRMRMGEQYSYGTSSSPIGIPAGSGVITSRRGDLCDVDHDVWVIARRVLAEAASSSPRTPE
jgi:hypothetical protein